MKIKYYKSDDDKLLLIREDGSSIAIERNSLRLVLAESEFYWRDRDLLEKGYSKITKKEYLILLEDMEKRISDRLSRAKSGKHEKTD